MSKEQPPKGSMAFQFLGDLYRKVPGPLGPPGVSVPRVPPGKPTPALSGRATKTIRTLYQGSEVKGLPLSGDTKTFINNVWGPPVRFSGMSPMAISYELPSFVTIYAGKGYTAEGMQPGDIALGNSFLHIDTGSLALDVNLVTQGR